MLTEDHVPTRKSFRFGVLRTGPVGTGGKPMVCGRGAEVLVRSGGRRDDARPETLDLLVGGEYGGTASGYGATE